MPSKINLVAVLILVFSQCQFSFGGARVNSGMTSLPLEVRQPEVFFSLPAVTLHKSIENEDSLSDHFFNKPLDREYLPWSIYLNYHPGLLFNYKSDVLDAQGRLFAYNPSAGIEPVWQYSERWSIGLPVAVGFSYGRTDGICYGSYSFSGFGIFTGQYAPGNYPVFDLDNAYWALNRDSLRKIHSPEIKYQVGVSAKFYPFGQRRNSFYVGQQISLGKGNYNQANFYYHIDTITYSWDPEVTYWTGSPPNVEYHYAEFAYLRFETDLGIDFNISKLICLNVEGTFSNAMRNKKQTDSIFFSMFNGPYELYGTTEVIAFDRNPGNTEIPERMIFSIKVSLLIKFGTKGRKKMEAGV